MDRIVSKWKINSKTIAWIKMETNNGIVVNALPSDVERTENGMLTKSNDVTIYAVISLWLCVCVYGVWLQYHQHFSQTSSVFRMYYCYSGCSTVMIIVPCDASYSFVSFLLSLSLSFPIALALSLSLRLFCLLFLTLQYFSSFYY